MNMEYLPLRHKEDTIIGIVGGMGPEAGLDLVRSIHKYTKAEKDQDHFSTVLMSFPKQISDRTAFINGEIKNNPGYEIAKVIRKLERAGASLVGIACNSSYNAIIYDVIQKELRNKQSDIRLLNMPYETCNYIKRNHPDISRIGVMSTNGTYLSGTYHKRLKDMGFEVIIPDYDFQNDVIHEMVYNTDYGIKSKSAVISFEVQNQMQKALNFFEKMKAEAVILGCTELALIPKDLYTTKLHLFNSNELFAIALIEQAQILEKLERSLK